MANPIPREDKTVTAMTNALLTLIAENKAGRDHVDSYLAETPISTLRLVGMGFALANWLAWSREDLVTVLLVALENTNKADDWVKDIEKATGVVLP